MPEKHEDAKNPSSETAPDQRWKLQVFYLCFYGFMTQIRPGESFITPYLLGADRNFTKAEVSRGQLVPPGVPLSGHHHYHGAGQSILLWSWGVEGCRHAMFQARWCVVMLLGGWGGAWEKWHCMRPDHSMSLSHWAGRSPWPLSPRLNSPWHKTSFPGWQLILGADA